MIVVSYISLTAPNIAAYNLVTVMHVWICVDVALLRLSLSRKSLVNQRHYIDTQIEQPQIRNFE